MNGTPLAAVLSLDALLDDPGKVATLPPEAARALLIALSCLQPLLIQRALLGSPNGNGEADLLTVPEAAQRLKLSDYRVYELIRQGHLKRVPIGKAVRVKVADLAEFVRQRGG
jgi:excisionase family DNA binding protein